QVQRRADLVEPAPVRLHALAIPQVDHVVGGRNQRLERAEIDPAVYVYEERGATCIQGADEPREMLGLVVSEDEIGDRHFVRIATARAQPAMPVSGHALETPSSSASTYTTPHSDGFPKTQPTKTPTPVATNSAG